MKHRHQIASPPVLQRYESKFAIPKYMIKPISDFVSVYCSLDKYSARSKDGLYRVNSLYLDTPNYLFLMKMIDGSENRFTMRIRTYNNVSALPCFLEIKQRKGDIIRKYRAVVYDEDWQRMLDVPGYRLHKERDPSATSNKILFFRMAHSYNTTPKVLLQYLRKAYVSDVDDYGRVTFDTDLRYRTADGYRLITDKDKMVSFDNETLFDPGCNVVLELKCYTTRVPLWMIDLIRHFDLGRRNFSKYVAGATTVLKLYKYDPGSRYASLPF